MSSSSPFSHVHRGALIACIFAGLIASAGWRAWQIHSTSDQRLVASLDTDQVALPSPEMTPEQVVRMQLAALRDFRDDKLAIVQCYVLASPANRAYTGPLDRFAQLVQNDQYAPLVEGTETLIGKAVENQGHAVIMVTVVDRQRMASVYRFWLSRQASPPWRDCWMTDAVVLEHRFDSPAPPPVPPAANTAA